jgi:hypothetical protein
MSNQNQVAEGELFAYLSGENLPHVEQALVDSPELREKLDAIKTTLIGLRRRFGGMEIPDTQDLVDVACGQASPLQELRIAAYLRDSAEGRDRMLELLVEQQPSQARRGLFSLAIPGLAFGTRSEVNHSTEPLSLSNPIFVANEINAQIVLRIVPPSTRGWTIKGQVSRGGLPVPMIKVSLYGNLPRSRGRTTDENGFFQFTNLDAGSYHVRASLLEGTVITSPFTIHDEYIS